MDKTQIESLIMTGQNLAIEEIDSFLLSALGEMYFALFFHQFDKGTDEALNAAKETAFNRLAILISYSILARYKAMGLANE